MNKRHPIGFGECGSLKSVASRKATIFNATRLPIRSDSDNCLELSVTLMNFSSLRPRHNFPLVFTTLLAFCSNGQADVRFSDALDKETTSLSFASRDDEKESRFSSLPDELNILVVADDTAAASTTVSGLSGDFSLSVDVVANVIAYSAGTVGVFGFSAYAPGEDGLVARVRNDGFTADSYVLEILVNGSASEVSEPFNLTEDPSSATGFNLKLTGNYAPDGSLVLTADLTPDPSNNPASLPPVAISSTIAVKDLELNGSLFGIRQSIFGNNKLDTSYRNFTISEDP